MLAFKEYVPELTKLLTLYVGEVAEDEIWSNVYINSTATKMVDPSNAYLDILFNRAENHFNIMGVECVSTVDGYASSFELVNNKFSDFPVAVAVSKASYSPPSSLHPIESTREVWIGQEQVACLATIDIVGVFNEVYKLCKNRSSKATFSITVAGVN